jgi:hypothetical protein
MATTLPERKADVFGTDVDFGKEIVLPPSYKEGDGCMVCLNKGSVRLHACHGCELAYLPRVCAAWRNSLSDQEVQTDLLQIVL